MPLNYGDLKRSQQQQEKLYFIVQAILDLLKHSQILNTF